KNEKTDLEFDDFSLKEAVNSKNEDYIKQKIRERIDRASVTAVYLTPECAKSKWVDWEITESLKRRKGVIGVYKGDTPPDQLPTALDRYGIKIVK
ncbi:TIR domain-containing protein, partial [Thiolapillus sp.]